MADIEIAIDTTGSMGGAISQAKAQASSLVAAVQGEIPDAQFAVVDFRDSFDAEEYLVRQTMTSDASSIQTAINAMSAGGGGDFPEAYNLVFDKAADPVTGGDIGWRSGSRKFVVVIGDAPPHGAVPAGYNACFDSSPDPHGLNPATELAQLAAAQRTLFMVAVNSGIKPCYDQLVAGGFSGSASANLEDDIASQILALIEDASSIVADVHLQVDSASPAPAAASWVTFDPASYSDVETPATLDFLVNVTPPIGTPAGTYEFEISAIADGGNIGTQRLTVIVEGTEGPFGSPSCSDGFDNDGDTLTDGNDPGCAPPPPGCVEDGLDLLAPSGVASGTVHDPVEPLVGSLVPELQPVVHDLNCQLVVPVEDAVDDLLASLGL